MADDRGYELGEEALRQILRGLRKINSFPTPQPHNPRRLNHFSISSSGIGVYNNSGEDVPAFGIMRIVSATTLGEAIVYEIGKPNSTFERFYLVNGPTTLAQSAYGPGYYLDREGRALYDSADGTPAYGQWWGPYPSSWKLRRHMYGFRILGDANTTSTHVRCTQHIVMTGVLGKTDASHAKSATGTVSVWKGDHSADSGANISSVYNSFANVATTKWVKVDWNSETPGLYAAECA